MSADATSRRSGPSRAWKLAEVGVALALAALLFTTVGDPGWRPMWSWMHALCFGSTAAAMALLDVDPAGTARDLLIVAARSVLIFAPAVIVLFRMQRHRLAWLPLLILGVPVAGIFSLLYPDTWQAWALLLAVSALASALAARVRWAWILAAIPPIVACAPAIGHRAAPFFHDAESLAARCAANDGARPRNLTNDHLCAGYYGVTAATDERLLLTFRDFGASCPADAESRWLRWDGQDLWLGEPVALDGSHFRGCRLADSLWFVSDGVLSEVPIAPGPQAASVAKVYPQHVEWDSTDTACDAPRGAVYLGEASQGGLWTRTQDGTFHRRPFDAEGLFPMVRGDGRIVMASGHELWTFDPDADVLLDRTVSGIVTLGADLCAHDGTVVVGDLAGRLRFFAREGDGYRFDWGIAAGAPRFVAFSPDCRFVATGSLDDGQVWIIDRDARSVVRRFQVGPALRGLLFLDPRHVVSVDACTASVLAF